MKFLQFVIKLKDLYILQKNGAGDLAVMSIELYELLTDKHILYKELEKGINSLEKGEKISEEELYEELDKIQKEGLFVKKYNIEYSLDAKQDLIEIKQYIKYNLQEPEIAQKLILKIRKEISTLKNNPEIYTIIDDDIIKKLEIRKLMIDNYIVFYRIKNNNIQIVRIMYGRRNWINLL